MEMVAEVTLNPLRSFGAIPGHFGAILGPFWANFCYDTRLRLRFFVLKMYAVFSKLSLSGNLVFGLVRLK